MIRICIILLFLSSCSNRMVRGERHGFWKETDTIDGKIYIAKGRYNHGMQVGTWRYRSGKNLVKKEKYNGSDCRVVLFDEKKRIVRSGQTKLDVTDKELHWYYEGVWTDFDSVGNVIGQDLYMKGNLISE